MGKLGFFPYDTAGYKAAQAYLDRRAAEGWALKKVSLGVLARFEPAEGRSHFVDLDLERSFDQAGTDPDYVQLCADAGWEKVQTLRGMNLFRSLPGRSPLPLQTDPGLELERFWKKYLLKNLLGAAAALALLFLFFFAFGGIRPSSGIAMGVASYSTLLYVLALALGGASLLWTGASTLRYFLTCRKAGRITTPGPKASRVRGALSLLFTPLMVGVLLLGIAESNGLGVTADLAWTPFNKEYTASPEICQTYPVVTAADLGLAPSQDIRYLDGHRSFLADYLSYSEISDGADGSLHILTTERYHCAGESLARWVMAQRRKETAQGRFLWGTLDWAPAPGLGFDESYTARDGSYLLLRQGNTVALVGAQGLDLTQPEYLSVLTPRLKLEGTP